MSLPITKRNSQFGEYLPNKNALLACFEIASLPEAADYMVSKFTERLKQTKMLEKSEQILAKVKEYATNVHLQRDFRGDPWTGNTQIKTDFQNLQQNLAESAMKTVSAKVKGAIKIDYAISDLSQLLRGFSADQKAADPELASALDKLFNSWLAENNMISKGGIIYEATSNGEIRKDEAGNPIKANAEKFSQLIADDEKGFQKYLNGQDLPATVERHAYPDQKPQIEVQPVVETPVPAHQAASSEAAGPQEAPSAKGGMGAGS